MSLKLVCAIFTLAPALLGAEEDSLFEVKGKVLARRVYATASLFDTASPFNQKTDLGLDGSFKFKKIPAGTYVLSIFFARRGEMRRTLVVGPGSADRDGRIVVELRPDRASLETSTINFVSIRALSVPKDAKREFAKGVKKLSKRDVAAGIQHFERAVGIAPQFAAAWNYLGTIAYQDKRFDEAERLFRRAREADPESYEPVINLGGVLLTLGKWQEAEDFNQAAVAQRPKDALAQAQLGLTHLRLGAYDLAEKHLLLATRLDPKHFSNPQIYLAEVYLKKNDRRRAARQLADLLHYKPDWPNAAKVRETISQWSRSSSAAEIPANAGP